MTAIRQSLLKLLPANPILLRVVTAGGRRLRHAVIRFVYLGLLIAVLLVALMVANRGASLSELAKASTQVFATISYVQLGMICLLAPIFTAAAITQERDSRTYNILLATPLTNAQIVLGSLLSRLYFVLALLLSGVPVFAITLFYGGVTGMNIVLSFMIALSTGLFMGSLAIAIAVFRLGTGKTVFWFYVFNAVYLVGIWLIDANLSGATGKTTWLTGIHPFLALMSVVAPTAYTTPDYASLGGLGWPARFYLAYPAYAYILLTLGLSVLLVGPSALVLRRVAQRSDTGMWQYLRHLIMPGLENRTRKARRVWSNPVAWREAATRAGASARGVTRWLTILIGVSAAAALLWMRHRGVLDVEETRNWLVGLVVVEFSVALLVATNTSAAAVTRERESQTLDLLLVTPITSKYYIWGKLRGLVSFMLPFVAVPTVTIMMVVLYDAAWGSRFTEPVIYPEVLLTLPLFLTVVTAWACMLGLQLSLKWSRTLVAVMASVGTLAGIAGVLGVCGFAALNFPVVGLIFSPLSPFTGVCVLLNPTRFGASSFAGAGGGGSGGIEVATGRVVLVISYLVACGAYCLVVWGMYRSMVKNFDMIIRRQHQ